MAEPNKMTVTRALAELKTLDRRINKAIADSEVIKVRRKEDKWDVQEFCRTAQGQYQSAVDLINRRNALKSKVLDSNAVTRVKIGEYTYTIAEIIDRKQSLQYKKTLLLKLRNSRTSCQNLYEAKTDELRRKLDHLLEVNFGKDGKSNAETVPSITKSFWESNKVEQVDPVNISARIKELEDEITEFEKEADLVLSEANARTYFEV